MSKPAFDEIKLTGFADHWCCPACYNYFSQENAGETACPSCGQSLRLIVDSTPVSITRIIENEGEQL